MLNRAKREPRAGRPQPGAPPGRSRLPAPLATLVAVVAGLLALITYFVRDSFVVAGYTINLADYGDLLLGLVSILLGFALLVGLANLLRVHLTRIGQQQRGWPYSAVLLGSAVATIAVGVTGSLLGGAQGLSSGGADWIFRNIYQPLGSTFYSLLAFFIAAAAFRVLRARSVEAGIMAVVALVIVLALAPISQLPELRVLNDIGNWLLNYPVQAGVRGIAIGAALGVIATSVRVLLGVDRQYLGLG